MTQDERIYEDEQPTGLPPKSGLNIRSMKQIISTRRNARNMSVKASMSLVDETAVKEAFQSKLQSVKGSALPSVDR